mmetsp:Transcript_11074/g.24421  ORF Transcript_11074/g.24421 Transcript_11074/m.24421 type:complete len:212 (-) Transcript_11074:312-947(-)
MLPEHSPSTVCANWGRPAIPHASFSGITIEVVIEKGPLGTFQIVFHICYNLTHRLDTKGRCCVGFILPLKSIVPTFALSSFIVNISSTTRATLPSGRSQYITKRNFSLLGWTLKCGTNSIGSRCVSSWRIDFITPVFRFLFFAFFFFAFTWFAVGNICCNHCTGIVLSSSGHKHGQNEEEKGAVDNRYNHHYIPRIIGGGNIIKKVTIIID